MDFINVEVSELPNPGSYNDNTLSTHPLSSILNDVNFCIDSENVFCQRFCYLWNLFNSVSVELDIVHVNNICIQKDSIFQYITEFNLTGIWFMVINFCNCKCLLF